MSGNKLLISVAPVDAAGGEADPEKIARDVIACAKLGAGMVHLHVRDKACRLTDDLTDLKRTIALIRRESDIIIEASTGGVSTLTIDQRCAPLYCGEVEAVSLNVGSVNLGEAVYTNPIADVRTCVKAIVQTGKKPEIEVFEIGMIDTAIKLAQRYGLKQPLLFSVVLGHEGAAPATMQALLAMKSFIPDPMVWGITHAHRKDNALLAAAIAMGAKTVRIGFEDSHVVDAGAEAETNAPIVAEIVSLVRSLKKEAMTPDEARTYFHIQ